LQVETIHPCLPHALHNTIPVCILTCRDEKLLAVMEWGRGADSDTLLAMGRVEADHKFYTRFLVLHGFFSDGRCACVVRFTWLYMP
jgi:hypothetical protein